MPRATASEDQRCVSGAVWDTYRLVCLLGRGGMGEVWLAEADRTMGVERLVALKTISPRISADPRFCRLFLDEARVAARIGHPNVVPILGIGEVDGRPYYAMEWVDGESLHTLQKACGAVGAAIPTRIAARIVADVCLGLHAAHELRDLDGAPLHVVYRDVSPQNIILTEDGTPRVIDFGIVKARARVAETTRPGTMLGKLAYMAPEQASMSQVDRRTDVWGAGALLYHLIAGRTPFDERIAMDRLRAGARPEPLDLLAPGPLAAVVARALEPERAARFATALEMSLALERALRASGLSTVQRDVAEFAARYVSEQRRARREHVARALAGVRRGGSPSHVVADRSADSGVTTVREPQESPVDAKECDGPVLPALRGSPRSATLPRPRSPNGILVAAGGLGLLVALVLAGQLDDSRLATGKVRRRSWFGRRVPPPPRGRTMSRRLLRRSISARPRGSSSPSPPRPLPACRHADPTCGEDGLPLLCLQPSGRQPGSNEAQ